MTALETMKMLLGITTEDKNDILNFYLTKSSNAIINYLRIVEIPETLVNQQVELAIYYHKNKDNLGITQQSQGSRSVSMTNESIPSSIRSSLPLPNVKAGGN